METIPSNSLYYIIFVLQLLVTCYQITYYITRTDTCIQITINWIKNHWINDIDRDFFRP